LLEVIKRMVDDGAPAGSFWLTGSQNFEVMRGVRESLAGRVAILNLLGLSDEELKAGPETPMQTFDRIIATGFPKLVGITDSSARDLYISSYVQTYIERDVRELLGIQKRREFELFVKLCALRSGQIVNFADLARDAGISAVTAKEWVSLLEDSFLIRLVHPWHTNPSKRLIKSPKMYFLDAGLASWLSGWRTSEQARLGPMSGALLETHVCGQLVRHFRHRAIEAEIYHWRTRDGLELDFIVEVGGRIYPVEVKTGIPDARELIRLGHIRDPQWCDGTVLSLVPSKPFAIGTDWTARHITDLSFLSG
jgi:predicted AAA+ superfamily ATPase